MNLPATSDAAVDQKQDQAAINELLGTEPEVEEKPASETQAEEPAAKETPTEPGEREEPEAEAAEPADEAEKAEEPEEELEEESELALDERDRDYSQAAYEKAAKHYSRTHGITLNPDDQAHRVLLKEVMDRGRALSEREARDREQQAKGDEAKAKPADEAKATPTRPTPEQIKESLENIQKIAKARVVPEVSMHVANRFVKALWPGEDVKLTQEQANDFTSAMHEFFLMAIDDVAPALFGNFNQVLGADPIWGRVQSEAVDSSAFESLADKPYFSDMEKLVDDGTLKSIMAKNQNIFSRITSGDGGNPILNRAAQFEAAYKFARGDRTLDQVTKAVETGKKQATETAKKVAASRVAPGTPKGGFGQPASEGDQLVRNITSGDGTRSRFSDAVKSQLRK